jgi:hypothetical protein
MLQQLELALQFFISNPKQYLQGDKTGQCIVWQQSAVV